MELTEQRIGLLVLAFVAACAGPVNDKSAERVASVLRDSLGQLAAPHVGFSRDSTHLSVRLATVAFPTVPDSVLTEHARSVGSFALRHYEKANQLDSVSVRYNEAVRSGVWHIRHKRTFLVEDLPLAAPLIHLHMPLYE